MNSCSPSSCGRSAQHRLVGAAGLAGRQLVDRHRRRTRPQRAARDARDRQRAVAPAALAVDVARRAQPRERAPGGDERGVVGLPPGQPPGRRIPRHELGLDHRPQGHDAARPADAGPVDRPPRQRWLRSRDDVIVHPDHPRAQLACDARALVLVGRPDRRAEPADPGVAARDPVLLAVDGLDRQPRSRRVLAQQPRVLGHVGQHGGGEVRAVAPGDADRPAAVQRGAGGDGLVDERDEPLDAIGGQQRADLGRQDRRDGRRAARAPRRRGPSRSARSARA